jgi:hypothetical protein
MPRLIPSRLAAACALALVFALSIAVAPAAAKVSADLRVVGGGGKVLAEKTLKTGTTSVPTSAKATCFGPGTGGSGKVVQTKGANALGLLGQAAKSTAALRPLLISDKFQAEFGLALCGVGGDVATTKLSWYLKVNHVNPELGGELVKLKPGDEVLWALAPFPYPDELSLRAPDRVKAGTPFGVRVSSYDDKGKLTPAAGVKVTGAAKPTDASGRTTVVLDKPARLISRHGRDIPSNREAVCVGGRCPANTAG